MIPSHCLCNWFSMLKIKNEEGKMTREEDEEERMAMFFGNNKNKQK